MLVGHESHLFINWLNSSASFVTDMPLYNPHGCALMIPVPPPFLTPPQGALVSALADDSIHLWNLRQKIPAILHSLKFNRERYSTVFSFLLPFAVTLHLSLCGVRANFVDTPHSWPHASLCIIRSVVAIGSRKVMHWCALVVLQKFGFSAPIKREIWIHEVKVLHWYYIFGNFICGCESYILLYPQANSQYTDLENTSIQ